jgi:hypothetical protein
MNAVTLELLIKLYYLPIESIVWSDSHSEAKGVKALEALGLIDADYLMTEKGITHVETLLALPLPIQKWVSP